ncbi:MAG TPA: gamma-glutamyltransferase, partial [Steroidobacteraceae bacterium]|nr:gamma-glutamyltransferase [Steroidobacteraceae bacterium]
MTGALDFLTRRALMLVAVAALAVACTGTPLSGDNDSGAIAMPDRYSAAIAEEILDDGGNAVDAAIAAAFVLAVAYPEAGNIAGGGFMLLRFGEHAAFLDFREIAPAAATRDMYLDARGEIVDGASLNGHRAVAVPGTVAGLHAAHERYGTRPWRELLAPAIELAEEGIDVPQLLVDRVRDESPRLAGVESFARHFG